jgi:hypothetical protein
LILARQEKDFFREWLALTASRSWIHLSEKEFIGDTYNEMGKIRTLFYDITTKAVVKEWIEDADNKEKVLWEYIAREFEHRENFNRYNNSTAFLSSAVRNYWRCFRDLEINYAHPNQQTHFLKPLLKISAFNNFTEELEYRLKYGIRDISKALKKYATNIEPKNPNDRRLQDDKIVNLILEPPEGNKKWLKASLEAIDMLGEFIEKNDIVRIAKIIERCKTSFKDNRDIDYILPGVWRIYSGLEKFEVFFPKWINYRDQIKPDSREARCFCKELAYFPWGNWIRNYSEKINVIIQFVLDSNKVFNKNDFKNDVWCSEGILTALDEISEVMMSIYSGDIHEENIKKFKNQIIEIADPITDNEEMGENWRLHFRACRILIRETVPNSYSALMLKIKKILEYNFFNPPEIDSHIMTDHLLYSAAIAHELLAKNNSMQSEERDIVEFVWSNLEKNKTTIINFMAKNPHMSEDFIELFVETIAKKLPKYDQIAFNCLKEKMDIIPYTIPAVAKLFEKNNWSQKMKEIVIAKIYQAAGGMNGKESVSFIIASISLMRTLERNTKKIIPSELSFLKETAFWGIYSVNKIIANHSAYAIAQHSFLLGEENDPQRTIMAIRDISRDPRTTVRMAAAYGAGAGKGSGVYI